MAFLSASHRFKIACNVASEKYISKEAPNLLLEEIKKRDNEGHNHMKLVVRCLAATVYFIVYFTV